MRRIYQVFYLMSMVVFLGVSIHSCSGNKQKKKEAQQAREAIEQELKEIAYPLPSMFNLTQMLKNIEASYIITLSNDPNKVESYFKESKRALNLGSYASDLAYATTYNKQDEVQSYFKACELLVQKLDLTDAFDSSLPDEIKKNINDREALVEVVSGIFERAYTHLNEQGRTEISYLVLSGSVVEGLYLATNISQNAWNNPEIVKAIISQKPSLLKIQELMEPYKESELLKDVYKDITEINAIYNLTEGASAMTQEQIEKLTELVRDLRESYIN